MPKLMDQPVSLDTLVSPSEDYADSCTGSDHGDDEGSSACDDEPEPEKECEYTACACVDTMITAREAAELRRYHWLMNCFTSATTEVYEWKGGRNQIWVGIDVCPFYLEDVPAQVPLGKVFRPTCYVRSEAVH